MDAVLTAGGIPKPDEPLYPYTQGKSKALLDIAGKPMIQWVLDALGGSSKINNVIIIGLTADSGVTCAKPLSYLPNQGGMLANIVAGVDKALELDPKTEHILVVSSDIPAITAPMVDWVVEAASQRNEDIFYNLIPREAMEKRYPGSKRSFTHLKDAVVCGGDMHVVSTETVTKNQEIWNKLIETRKNVFKQAALIGFDTLFLLLTRLITLDQAMERVRRKLNISGRGILCPYAEVGMDVDKPHQLEMMRADLEQRTKS